MSTEFKTQVTADIYEVEPFRPLRIVSLTEQIRCLSRLGSANVLEVGVGKGLMRTFLSVFPAIRHTTVDYAADLHPDHVASVLDLSFADNTFDTAVCCQVLEHLPFEDFPRALSELCRVTSRWCVISLPDLRRQVGVGVCLFRFGWFKWTLHPEKNTRTPLYIDPNHLWEIGHSRATRGAAVAAAMRRAGFEIVHTYRLEGHAWHCFFILRKPATAAS